MRSRCKNIIFLGAVFVFSFSSVLVAEAGFSSDCPRVLTDVEDSPNKDFLDDFFGRRYKRSGSSGSIAGGSGQQTPGQATSSSNSNPGNIPVPPTTGQVYRPQLNSVLSMKTFKPAHRVSTGYSQWYSQFTLSVNGEFLIYTPKSIAAPQPGVNVDHNRIAIMELGTWRIVTEIVHSDMIRDVLQTKDGNKMFVASLDNTVSVINPHTWNTVNVLKFKSVDRVYLTPDDKNLIVINQQGSAEIIDVASLLQVGTQSPVSTDTNGNKSILAFTHDGSHMVNHYYSNDHDGHFRIIRPRIEDLRTGGLLTNNISLGTGKPYSAAVSPDKRFLAFGAEKGLFGSELLVYQWGSWVELKRETHSGPITKIFFTDDSQFLILVSLVNVVIYRTSDWQVVKKENHNHFVVSCSLMQPACILISTSAGGKAHVLEVGSWNQRLLIDHHVNASVNSAAAVGIGENIVTVGNDNTALVSNGLTGVQVSRIQHNFHVNGVLISPPNNVHGQFIITRSNGSEIIFTKVGP